MLGTAERERAFSTVHAGAVYLHLGDQYAVSALDLERRAALVRPVTVDWYTQARKETARRSPRPSARGASPAWSSSTGGSRSPSR